jgi:hypothetical protein
MLVVTMCLKIIKSWLFFSAETLIGFMQMLSCILIFDKRALTNARTDGNYLPCVFRFVICSGQPEVTKLFFGDLNALLCYHVVIWISSKFS